MPLSTLGLSFLLWTHEYPGWDKCVHQSRAVHLIGELFNSSLIFSIKKCHQIRSYLTGHYGIVRITFQGGPIFKTLYVMFDAYTWANVLLV